MAAWTNHKSTAIPVKQVLLGRLSKVVKPTDIEKNPGAKAVEGKHQDAAIAAAEIMAKALRGVDSAGNDKGHVTITMSGTSTNPPANGDVISVAVTLANAPGADKESDVQGRV